MTKQVDNVEYLVESTLLRQKAETEMMVGQENKLNSVTILKLNNQS